ncbi:MAG: ATP-binding protein [Gemmatimonadetes bacterium]|nr:ATP-binding protein [Gemmatimonadota bacterium]MYK65015.1 ATP-binding protein [Gemmatimonadota bacterium]
MSEPPPKASYGRVLRKYWPRVADDELRRRLVRSGAVLIEGPRACGKTVTASQIAASSVMLDTEPSARRAAAVDPGFLLEGETPRLIDEWQLVPEIWNRVRHAVDERPGRGHFILTGSAVPPDDITRHTGAGRIGRLRLRPMSLFELEGSNGAVSLRRLLAGDPVPSTAAQLSIRRLADLVCVGGWPGHLGSSDEDPPLSVEDAMAENRDYLGEVCRTDIRRVDGSDRDPARVGRFLQSVGRNVATSASMSTLARDAGAPDRYLTNHTARSYMTALERLMIVEDQPPWAPHLRSRSRLRTAAKRHFTDPSLAVAALSATPEHLLRDFEWFGLLFESMVVRDLRVYAQASGADVYHYRDNTGLEVDAIVDAGPGRWAAFEIKLGASRVDDGAKTLLRLADRVDTDRCGKPAALGVIVGSGYGYARPDGVGVIPVGELGV